MAEESTPSFLNNEHFNGEFYIFSANVGDLFFHGSSHLASKLVLFPTGSNFSNNLRAITPQILNRQITRGSDKNSIISRLGNEEPAFFSNIDTSIKYSGGEPTITNSQRKCKGKCIHTFELNQNVDIMVMNNVFNVYKIIRYIINNPGFRQIPEVRNIFNHASLRDYDTDEEKLNFLFGNFYCVEEPIFRSDGVNLFIDEIFNGEIDIPAPNVVHYSGDALFGRFSVRKWDIPLSMLICAYFSANPQYNIYNIKGCGNNEINMGIIGSARQYIFNGENDLETFNTRIHMCRFHPEVIFFKPLKVLNRVYTNPMDWQYNTSKDNTRYIKPYLNQLEKYKIINFNDYAGDIYETTIWTLLIYENLSIRERKCSMNSAPVALLSHYLEPYSLCMDRAIVNRIQENYLLDMRQVTWNNVFHVISTNLFNELQNHVQLHDSDNLIYMKIVTYVYLSYKDAIIDYITINPNFNIPNSNDIFSKIFNLMWMYNIPNSELEEYCKKVIIDVFYLALSAYIAKSSTFDFFEFRSQNVINNADEVVNVRREKSMNISSRIFPFLSNISSVDRGYPYNQMHIDALLDNLEYYIDFEIDQDQVEEIKDKSNQILLETNRFFDKLQKLDIEKLTPGDVPPIVYLSGRFYAPYVTKIVHNIITLCPDGITIDDSTVRGNKRQNIIYILKLLKPFFNIVFEEFSTKRYPTEEDNYTLPRKNHNGLNHLRSVYFTAYVLETSNFIEHYNIDNNELFLILLSSYFVSIARFDEDDARLPNINFTPAEYYKWHGIVLNRRSDYFYQDNFECTHFRYMSSLILADVFEIIKRKIPGLRDVDVPTKFNIDNALHLSALSFDFMYLVATAVDHNRERIIDFTSILTVGHYFDHSRPTTGYAQLDNLRSGNPQELGHNPARGPDWLYNFIVKFYPVDPNDWTTRKSFYYSRIYQTLQESGFGNRVLRDPIPMNHESGSRMDARQNQNIFKLNVTYNFDAMSIDFHLAWKNIFSSFFDQNYNIPEGTWITRDGTDRNTVNTP